MNNQSAHTRWWETAEVLFGAALLVSLVIGLVIPLPLSALLPRTLSIAVGIFLLLCGTALIVVTRRQFRQSGQPTDPGSPTTQLITEGIFAWSRNPLYLAGMVFFLGLAAVLNSLWLLILLIPTIAAVQYLLIAPEEKYLDEKFGEPYRQYVRSVRRWFGRRR